MLNHRNSMWSQTFRPHCISAQDLVTVTMSRSNVFTLHKIALFQDIQETLSHMFSTRLNRTAENMKFSFVLESLWFRHIHERTHVFSQQLSVNKKTYAWSWPFRGFRRVIVLCLLHWQMISCEYISITLDLIH